MKRKTISTQEELTKILASYDSPYMLWENVLVDYSISEEIIEKNFDFMNKIELFQYQQLSEKFIKKHIDNMTENSIIYLCIYQKLSEGLIRELKDSLNWIFVSMYQKLSMSFIGEFKNKIHFALLICNPCFTNEMFDCYVNNGKFLYEEFTLSYTVPSTDVNTLLWGMVAKFRDLDNLFYERYKKYLSFENYLENRHKKEEILGKLRVSG